MFNIKLMQTFDTIFANSVIILLAKSIEWARFALLSSFMFSAIKSQMDIENNHV
jgi:hypothetical protein